MKATILIILFVSSCVTEVSGNAPDEASATGASSIDDDWQTGCDPDAPWLCEDGSGGIGGQSCAYRCNSDVDCWGCPATYACVYDGGGSGLGKVCAFAITICPGMPGC